MRLVKLQDSSTRAITGLDLLMKFGFGNSTPTEFISGNTYESGQYVYQLNDKGSFDLYLCVESGRYDKITNQGWAYASISSLINQTSTDKVVVSEAVSVDTGDIYDTEYLTLNSDNVTISDDYIVNVNMTVKDGDRLELYVNDKFISNQDWTIEPVMRDLYQITMTKHIVINDLVLIHKHKKHINANLIGYCEAYPQFVSINGSTLGQLPETEEDLFEGAIFTVTDSNIKLNISTNTTFINSTFIICTNTAKCKTIIFNTES